MLPQSITKQFVVVVEDDSSQAELVRRWLESEGYEAAVFSSGESCILALGEIAPSTVLLDLNMPGKGGIFALREIKARFPLLPVIMMTADLEVGSVVAAMQAGAYDYLGKPLDRTKLLNTVKNAVERNQMALRLAHLEQAGKESPYSGIIGVSAPIKELFRQLDQISASDITVLIQGQSGTGKELVAKAIHRGSARGERPFIALNCAAIPESLHESELFGYEKGAFTGAAARRKGKLEIADSGTLFLDEVAELSASLQAKLLRVLQERKFQRVGGTEDISSDFRLIAASHVELEKAVEEGRFRADLYFRIAVFELEIPSLAERKEDIPVLAMHFLDEFNRGRPEPTLLSEEALDALTRYSFPGNVRELQNALQRAAVVAQNYRIRRGDLPARILRDIENPAADRPHPSGGAIEAARRLPRQSMDDIEKDAIIEAIRRTNGNMSEVIRQLKIGRATLYRKLKKYNIGRAG